MDINRIINDVNKSMDLQKNKLVEDLKKWIDSEDSRKIISEQVLNGDKFDIVFDGKQHYLVNLTDLNKCYRYIGELKTLKYEGKYNGSNR